MANNCYELLQKEIGPLTGNGVRIAMIDSGWDYSLKYSYIDKGIGIVSSKNELKVQLTEDYNDRIGHGTSCSYLFNKIASQSKITPVRIYGNKKITSALILYQAIKWAVNQQFKLINISSGTIDIEIITPLYKICEEARNKGIIIVSTMHHGDIQQYPALFSNVISVGGFKNIDSHYTYYHRPDNAMEYATKIDDLKLLTLGGEFENKSALSYTAPIISGFIALLLERYPKYSLDEVRVALNYFANT